MLEKTSEDDASTSEKLAQKTLRIRTAKIFRNIKPKKRQLFIKGNNAKKEK